MQYRFERVFILHELVSTLQHRLVYDGTGCGLGYVESAWTYITEPVQGTGRTVLEVFEGQAAKGRLDSLRVAKITELERLKP